MRTRKPNRPSLELLDFRHGTARWNERIRIDPRALPPRQGSSEPHCRWRIAMTEDRVDSAAEPGDYVKEHGLGREADAEIVNHEAGKYSWKKSGQAKRAASAPGPARPKE